MLKVMMVQQFVLDQLLKDKGMLIDLFKVIQQQVVIWLLVLYLGLEVVVLVDLKVVYQLNILMGWFSFMIFWEVEWKIVDMFQLKIV